MSTTTLRPLDRTEPTTTIRAPRRFDTHTVDAFHRQLVQSPRHASERIIDGSDVVFIDRDAVEALVAAGFHDSTSGLRVDEPSLAFRLTLELLELPQDVALAAPEVHLDTMERAA